MKICHVITRFILGGAQENTLTTIIGLAKLGHDVTLVTGPSTGREGKLLNFFPELKKKLPFKLVVEPNLIRPINPYYDFLAYKNLKQFFKEEKFDIIHTHSSKAGVVGRLAACEIRSSGISKIVHTIHGLAFDNFQPFYKNKLYIATEQKCAKFADVIISVCDAMTQQALEANIGHQKLYHTIYSGFDILKFKVGTKTRDSLRDYFKIPKETIVLLAISRLFPMKGIDLFLKILKTATEKNKNKVKGIILGDGPMRSELENFAKNNLPENSIIFAGLTPPNKIPDYIAASDIIIHGSLREGLARVLVQGLAAGKPVITYDIGGAKEIVKNNVNGFICSPNNKTQFIKNALNLINNKINLERLITGANRTNLEQFSSEIMVKKIETLYKKIKPHKKHKKIK